MVVGDFGSKCELVGPDGHLFITSLFRDKLTTIFKYFDIFFFHFEIFFISNDHKFHHVGVD